MMDCSVTACLVFEGDQLNHVRRHHRHEELSFLISVLWSEKFALSGIRAFILSHIKVALWWRL